MTERMKNAVREALDAEETYITKTDTENVVCIRGVGKVHAHVKVYEED